LEIIGTIKEIFDTVEISSSFQKRDLVVTTNEQYPQHITIEFNQKLCSVMDGYKIGQSVKVSINLRGKEYTNKQGETKYYNSVHGWKIELDNF